MEKRSEVIVRETEQSQRMINHLNYKTLSEPVEVLNNRYHDYTTRTLSVEAILSLHFITKPFDSSTPVKMFPLCVSTDCLVSV